VQLSGQTLTLYPQAPIVEGEPLHLIGRAEGPGGVLGDCLVTVDPSGDLFGLSYAAALAELLARGCIEVA
jgi:hypothetical protein